MKEKDKKEDLLFLEDLDFDKESIEEIYNRFTEETIKLLNDNCETVKVNISYLKNLGISNYQEAFIRFYNMFLMEPTTFDDIFSKYDKDDLVVKLEKNIAILEHL